MDELKQILENAGIKPVLKEYLVRSGDSFYKGVQGLNVFTDMEEGQRPSDHEEEFEMNREWMHIELKYAHLVEEIEEALTQAHSEGRRITDEEAEAIEDVWYDGSDSYGDVETALEELPELYDMQLELIQSMLAGEFRGVDPYTGEQRGIGEAGSKMSDGMTGQEFDFEMEPDYITILKNNQDTGITIPMENWDAMVRAYNKIINKRHNY